MASITPSSGILDNLFAPLPENRVTQENDTLDHVADYANSASGAWDVVRIFNTALSYLKLIPSISSQHSEFVGRVSTVADTAGIGLSIPQIFSDCNTLRRSISNLCSVQDLPYSDPLRTRRVAQAAKKGFLDSMNLTNTLSQAALFTNQAKIFVFETVHLNVLNGVYNATSFVTDGAELVGEYFKLKHYHSPEAQPRNQTEASKLEERKTLAWITIGKDVASVAGASIALLAIAFGIATQGAALISGACLVLSTVWLTMKLIGYFYNKIVVEAPPPSSLRIAMTF
jgi:hypothetical protein